jgi:hypothetical protein
MSPPLLPNEFARRSAGAIDVRADAMRLRLELPAMMSRDHHDLRCTFDCSVRVAENHSDRKLFGEVMLADRESLRREDVARYLTDQIRARVEAIVTDRHANDLLSGPARDELTQTIRTATDAAAFACGLVIMPPYQLDVQSGSVQRERLQQMQRVHAEKRSAEQAEHLRRAGELLKTFQTIRESSSEISPGQILERIAPPDRGSTLEALLAASSHQDGHATLWAVAGQFLARIEPGDATPKIDLYPMPATLGPLRSVQAARVEGNDILLIGARSGVLTADRDRPLNDVRAYSDLELKSELGFNRVVALENNLVATHADGGVVEWSCDVLERPARSLREFGRDGSSGAGVGSRNVHALDANRIVFTAGNQIIARTGDTSTSLSAESNSTIVSLVLSPGEFIAVHEDGLIVRYDRATLEPLARENRGGRINAACALPWLGSIRLLLAREDGAVECVGVDDQLVTQYLSVHRGCKMVTANAAVVAAVSSDRQRLILWHSWDGRKPFAEVHLTSQTKHRIADVEFA